MQKMKEENNLPSSAILAILERRVYFRPRIQVRGKAQVPISKRLVPGVSKTG